MNLPNAHRARIEREKIITYLLNPTHRYGAIIETDIAAEEAETEKLEQEYLLSRNTR